MIKIPEIPYIYPVFILLSFFISFFVIFQLNKKNVSKNAFFWYSLRIFIYAMTGGVLLSILENAFNNHVFKVGLSSYGAVIGLIISLFVYLYKNKKINGKISKYTDKLVYDTAVALPLMYGVAKVACGLNGCCAGIEYSGLLSVLYINEHISRFPVQFLESIVFIFIYIVFVFLNKKKYNNKLLGVEIIICAIFKFSLEFLRESAYLFDTNQYLSIVFILVGIMFLLRKNDRTLN